MLKSVGTLKGGLYPNSMCTTLILVASVMLTCPVEVSFYTRAEGWNGGHITRSGIAPYEGIVASNTLEFGTRFTLWDEEYVVEDTGGGLGHRQIDVFFDGPQAIARGYNWLWQNRHREKVITIHEWYEYE